jgi:hypothetical protein
LYFTNNENRSHKSEYIIIFSHILYGIKIGVLYFSKITGKLILLVSLLVDVILCYKRCVSKFSIKPIFIFYHDIDLCLATRDLITINYHYNHNMIINKILIIKFCLNQFSSWYIFYLKKQKIIIIYL